MNELIAFLSLVFVAYVFMPAGIMSRKKSSLATSSAGGSSKVVVPEDSVLKRHFLTHLRATVETETISRPIDPALRHYYEALIAAEIQKRLAGYRVVS